MCQSYVRCRAGASQRGFARRLGGSVGGEGGNGVGGGALWDAAERGPRSGASDPSEPGRYLSISSTAAGWGALPAGMAYGEAAAVCVDSKDNVYVFTRGAHPVIVFDRDGKFSALLGSGHRVCNPARRLRSGPTICCICTDDHGRHGAQVHAGRQSAARRSERPKTPAPCFRWQIRSHRCTHTALSPQRRYPRPRTAYQNARVHRVLARRKTAVLVGRAPGTDPGQFNHRAQHRVRRRRLGLCRRSRESPRAGASTATASTTTPVEQSGAAVRGSVRRQRHEPAGVHRRARPGNRRDADPAACPTWVRASSIVSADGKSWHAARVLSPLGEGPGHVHSLRTASPVDSRGDIYVAEVSRTYWTVLYGKKPEYELRCFQKLVRVS